MKNISWFATRQQTRGLSLFLWWLFAAGKPAWIPHILRLTARCPSDYLRGKATTSKIVHPVQQVFLLLRLQINSGELWMHRLNPFNLWTSPIQICKLENSNKQNKTQKVKDMLRLWNLSKLSNTDYKQAKGRILFHKPFKF